MKIENKTHSKDEILEQISSILSDNLVDKEYVIDNFTLDCKYNWLGENSSSYKILTSRDYEINLKIKGLQK